MRKLILAWILAGLSVAACVTQANREPPPPPTVFEQVCEQVNIKYGLECGDLAPPIVVQSKLVPPDYYGLYIRGEPYIFIGMNLDDQEPWWVEAHETVHYVLDQLGHPYIRCSSEADAREITSILNGQPVDQTWRARYGC